MPHAMSTSTESAAASANGTAQKSNPDAHSQLAAIDLGSNSFHLTIAREVQGELQLIDRIGEKVQLASGLDDNKHLEAASMDRGMACLERFAQRIQGIPDASVRIVGTNTLRIARNRDVFIDRAEALLGSPVEVISGREEARLIYLGVAHSCADDEEQRLVIDIGGGSTELIIGKRFTPIELESLHMGCVSYTLTHFPDGKLKKRHFEQAIKAAHLELLPIRKIFKKQGWKDVMGASGTIKALYRLANQGQDSQQPLTLDHLYAIRDRLLTFEQISDINLENVKSRRAATLPGGVAILIALFEALALANMKYSDGALREGLLYDHIGRLHHEDVRERTLSALMERYHVDQEQAQAVEQGCQYFLAQTAFDDEDSRNLLNWAARIHEIGLAISHSHFQKHGAYLVAHSDLMGFNQDEQQLLALLVRGHRRKLPVAELGMLPGQERQRLLPLLLILRLAATLHHSRQSDELPDIRFSLSDSYQMQLEFPPHWLEEHPLTQADLEQEQNYLQVLHITLDYQ